MPKKGLKKVYRDAIIVHGTVCRHSLPPAYPAVNYICLGENTMDKKIYDTYVRILEEELVPALGCTEPIALAYAAAKAGEVLGTFPEHLTVACSGNIIKNVKGVTVPNSGGMKGVEAAAVLGLTGGDPGQALEVLETVKEADISRTKELIKNGFCDCVLKEGVANLYIEAKAVCKEEEAIVVIEDEHTNITRIEKNGNVLFEKEEPEVQAAEITDDEKLGTETQVKIVSVDIFADDGNGNCPARLRTYNVIPDTSGDGTDALIYSGSFKAASGITKGYCTTTDEWKTCSFTKGDLPVE